ncbi:MAG: hypothetical protein ACOX1P_13305 [Thermoguttaceae bacterium]|jgi:hypothetical protein
MYDSFSRPTETENPCATKSDSIRDGGQRDSRSGSLSPPTRRVSHRGFAKFDETPNPIRWVRRILAVLILLCLAMAAWVWADILHGLP